VRERSLTLSPGAALRLFEGWLSPAEADDALADLLRTTPWAQQNIVLFGRSIPQPRLTAWMGDPDSTYTYSGLTQHPAPWTPAVAALRTRVEATAERAYNGVLLNLYRDGDDSMGLHADDEPELGKEPVIASVSLGAERTFVLKPKKRQRESAPLRLVLPHGSLLVMDAAVQQGWVHGVPKEPRVRAPRVNLTFRCVYTLDAAASGSALGSAG
jgi:alkylated DNA repair dioxygenase AlkB